MYYSNQTGSRFSMQASFFFCARITRASAEVFNYTFLSQKECNSDSGCCMHRPWDINSTAGGKGGLIISGLDNISIHLQTG